MNKQQEYPYSLIKNIKFYPQQEKNLITVKGWIKTIRSSKNDFAFLTINDGSNVNGVQVVLFKNLLENYDEVSKLTTGSSIEIKGEIVLKEQQKENENNFEIKAHSCFIYGKVENPETYPIPSKKLTLEHLRENGHLKIRTTLISSVMRIRHTVSNAIHNFFHQEGFYWMATPLITASDTEGAGEMFQVTTLDLNDLPKNENGDVDYSKDFFGKQSFLTVSGQLNAEAFAMGLGKVYTFGPTFRAENSNTSRHLAEFWMIEPEVAFADLNDNAKLAENMLKYVFKQVLEENKQELSVLDNYTGENNTQKLINFIQSDFIQIDYSEAIDILLKAIDDGWKFENPVSWGIDLNSEHEKYLTNQHFKAPVVVKNYPKDIKAFYMKLNDDGKTVAAMDVLAPGIGEIIGGSQREDRIEILDQRIQEMGLKPEDYWWYRDLRKYGSVPHSGFGLGLERLIVYITGLANVKDVIPFARTPKNILF